MSSLVLNVPMFIDKIKIKLLSVDYTLFSFSRIEGANALYFQGCTLNSLWLQHSGRLPYGLFFVQCHGHMDSNCELFTQINQKPFVYHRVFSVQYLPLVWLQARTGPAESSSPPSWSTCWTTTPSTFTPWPSCPLSRSKSVFLYRNPPIAADVLQHMVSIDISFLDTFVLCSLLSFWRVFCCQLRQEITFPSNFMLIDEQGLYFGRSSALQSFYIWSISSNGVIKYIIQSSKTASFMLDWYSILLTIWAMLQIPVAPFPSVPTPSKGGEQEGAHVCGQCSGDTVITWTWHEQDITPVRACSFQVRRWRNI